MLFDLTFLLIQGGLFHVCWALSPSTLKLEDTGIFSSQCLYSTKCNKAGIFPFLNGREERSMRGKENMWSLYAVPPPGGIKVDPLPDKPREESESTEKISSPFQERNVNEIDFCMAPSDVSLSRSYGSGDEGDNMDTQEQGKGRILSLTRALNVASNRAIRRILLSRSWPSPEALNESLRQVLASSSSPEGEAGAEESTSTTEAVKSSPKCPVPRPILNIIMRRRGDPSNSIQSRDKAVIPEQDEAEKSSGASGSFSSKKGRTNEEWVQDQIEVFRESYGELSGYKPAEAYLESILSLATSGVESPRVAEVLVGKKYDEAYLRFVSVLKSVGTVFEEVPDSSPPLAKIAPKLIDRDICLSMIDKMSIAKEKMSPSLDKNGSMDETPQKENSTVMNESTETTATNADESTLQDPASTDEAGSEGAKLDDGIEREKYWFMFWKKGKGDKMISDAEMGNSLSENEENMKGNSIKPEDLGGVLLSAEEPTMTRQLNVLSNIVKRTLLFGGRQELLVLSETLDADKPAFSQRWYPEKSELSQDPSMSSDEEQRSGVQYYNCLVQLLKDCYSKGEIIDLNPPFPLITSYANAYERLTCSLVELGSGYVKPLSLKQSKMALPKTPKEEFGRFAQWESSVRKSSPDISAYPDDVIGPYQVKDEVAGKTIGVSTVVLGPGGKVLVAPPMQGLRWRLDPGPTHLDTCTFQVLSDDGAVLQYKGFIDRGARLEARFSKRPIVIRGAVTFQMRDGEAAIMGDDYWKDMLPVNVKTETTKFVMTKTASTPDEGQ